MKKLFLIIPILMLFVGCGEKLNNTPTKQVEMFFMNYQTLSENVINDLNNTLENDTSMNDEQKEKYKKIIKEHYKNLVYDIKDEEVNGNSSVVTVEIEVTDYSRALASINEYIKEHRDEFYDNDNLDEEKYMDYRLEQLSKAKEKVKYTLDINLTKVNDKWQMNELTSTDEDKILGIYEY